MHNPGASALESATIASLIVDYARFQDLLALSASCKALNAPAEKVLYRAFSVSDPNKAYRICQTLSSNSHLAQHVRYFALLYRQSRNTSMSWAAPLPIQFWRAVHHALNSMTRLESLVMSDPSGLPRGDSYTWVLPAEADFRLRELRIQMPWDEDSAAFVARQRHLHSLQSTEISDAYVFPVANPLDRSEPLLPLLEILDAPFRVARQFLDSPLTHLQVFPDIVDSEDCDTLEFISHLWRVRKTLRSLCIHDMHEPRVVEVLRLAARNCPSILYIGILPLPPVSRTAIHASLFSFPKLAMLEIDLGAWNPAAQAPMQKALATELHTYCPALRVLIIWLNNHRFVWRLQYDTGTPQWVGRVESAGGGAGWRHVP
ncbi:hypothetical protein BV25DRAFT_1921027 [Artomyces pyxidatus]|uniref:Uncharacterized protein n=1 Tax=Artomyces pyxidatus TaxID=48021 RepID=A0ACB8SJG9_9AGAM|nr:hypothetical protein BV25DRAFT_1921027 [Artomyces pyxidatus]